MANMGFSLQWKENSVFHLNSDWKPGSWGIFSRSMWQERRIFWGEITAAGMSLDKEAQTQVSIASLTASAFGQCSHKSDMWFWHVICPHKRERCCSVSYSTSSSLYLIFYTTAFVINKYFKYPVKLWHIFMTFHSEQCVGRWMCGATWDWHVCALSGIPPPYPDDIFSAARFDDTPQKSAA